MKRRRIALAAILLGCAFGISACKEEAAQTVVQETVALTELATEESSTNEGATEASTEQESAEQESAKQESAGEGLTLDEAADLLIETAAKYGNQVQKDTLLKDLEDRKDEAADKIDMLVIVSRGFGNLPEPAEEKKEKGNVSLEAVPDWAMEDVENLKEVGALREGDLENTEATITKEDLEGMIQRIMNLYSN